VLGVCTVKHVGDGGLRATLEFQETKYAKWFQMMHIVTKNKEIKK
jgi:hypothetical protein